MGHFNKRFLGIVVLALALLVLTGIMRLIESDNLLFRRIIAFTIHFIYIGIVAAWGASIRHRVSHKRIRKYLLATVACMLFLIIVRTIKFSVLTEPAYLIRLAWYAFYIPILLIPLLALWAALCIGNSDTFRPEKKYRFLLIPTLLLILAMMTNEFHQLAFIIPPGEWKDNAEHNILYYIVVIWVLTLVLTTIYLLFRKSRIPGTDKIIWMPLAVVGIEILYTVLYINYPSKHGAGFIEVVAMTCAVTILLWESLIQTGLIPVNTNHQDLFTYSLLAAQITDEKGNACYQSLWATPPDNTTFARLKAEHHYQLDNDTLIHASSIRGGYVIWQEDITAINKLIKELDQTGQELKELADLTAEEYNLKARQISVRERIRLYNLLASHTEPQLNSIKRLLAEIPKADKQLQRQYLQQTNMLGTYIKRRSNLTLMAEAGEVITGNTMQLTLKESLEGLRQSGISATVCLDASCILHPDYAMLCHDLFQAMVSLAWEIYKRNNYPMPPRGACQLCYQDADYV